MKESILDPTRQTLDPAVFEETDIENPLFENEVRDFIIDMAAEYEQFGSIQGVYVIGSILSYQWTPTADIDLTIVLQPHDDEAKEQATSKAVASTDSILLPGTQHPVNPYIQSPDTLDLEAPDGVYDVLEDTWLRGPYNLSADTENWLTSFREYLQTLDLQKGELHRDIIDYQKIQDLPEEEQYRFEEYLQSKLEEIEEDVKSLVNSYEVSHKLRSAVMQGDMSHEELEKYASKNLLPANILYKLIERYHYNELLGRLKTMLHDEEEEIDEPDDVELVRQALQGESKKYQAKPLNEAQGPKELYHVSTAPPAIVKKEGLVGGKGKGFTDPQFKEWALQDEYFSAGDVFLSIKPWQPEAGSKEKYYTYKVNVEELSLYPDIPSLMDYGGRLGEEGTIWWKHDENVPKPLQHKHDEDGIPLSDLTYIDTLNVSGTCVAEGPIPPSRIRLVETKEYQAKPLTEDDKWLDQARQRAGRPKLDYMDIGHQDREEWWDYHPEEAHLSAIWSWLPGKGLQDINYLSAEGGIRGHSSEEDYMWRGRYDGAKNTAAIVVPETDEGYDASSFDDVPQELINDLQEEFNPKKLVLFTIGHGQPELILRETKEYQAKPLNEAKPIKYDPVTSMKPPTGLGMLDNDEITRIAHTYYSELGPKLAEIIAEWATADSWPDVPDKHKFDRPGALRYEYWSNELRDEYGPKGNRQKTTYNLPNVVCYIRENRSDLSYPLVMDGAYAFGKEGEKGKRSPSWGYIKLNLYVALDDKNILVGTKESQSKEEQQKTIKQNVLSLFQRRMFLALFHELVHWNTINRQNKVTDYDPYPDSPEKHKQFEPWYEWIAVLEYAKYLRRLGTSQPNAVAMIRDKHPVTDEMAMAAWIEAEQYQVEAKEHKALPLKESLWGKDRRKTLLKMLNSGDSSLNYGHGPNDVLWYWEDSENALITATRNEPVKDTWKGEYFWDSDTVSSLDVTAHMKSEGWHGFYDVELDFVTAICPPGIHSLPPQSLLNRLVDEFETYDIFYKVPYSSESWKYVFGKDKETAHTTKAGSFAQRARQRLFGPGRYEAKEYQAKPLNESMYYDGWISPVGKFYPCKGVPHDDKALEINDQLGLDIDENLPEDELLQEGWIRFARGRSFEVLKLNEYHLRRVKNFMESNPGKLFWGGKFTVDSHEEGDITAIDFTKDDIQNLPKLASQPSRRRRFGRRLGMFASKEYEAKPLTEKTKFIDTKYLYHCTGSSNIPNIAQKGLLPSQKPNWGGDLGSSSIGKVFLSTTPDKAAYYGLIVFREALAEYDFSYIPVLLRIKAQGFEIESDPTGYYLEEPVAPDKIELWWHGQWQSLNALVEFAEELHYEFDEEQNQYIDWEREPVGDNVLDAVADARELLPLSEALYESLLLEVQTISQYLKQFTGKEKEYLKLMKKEVRRMMARAGHVINLPKKMRDAIQRYVVGMVITNSGQNIERGEEGNLPPSKIVAYWQKYGVNLTYYKNWLQRIRDFLHYKSSDNSFINALNTFQYNAVQIEQMSHDWHEQLAKKGYSGRKGPAGRVILKLDHLGKKWKGWKWVSLDCPGSEEEGEAMGHCGNVGGAPGDNILSLRDPKDGAHLTFVENEGQLGQMKGYGNQKPAAKYHPAIVELLKSDHVKMIIGGGYMSKNNFHLTDLPEQQRQALLKQKPGLDPWNKIAKEKDVMLLNIITDQRFGEITDNPRDPNNPYVLVEEYDSFTDIQDMYLSEDSANLAWLDDAFDYIEPGADSKQEIDSVLKYSISEENEKHVAQILGVDPDEISHREFIDAIYDNDYVRTAFQDAIRDAVYVGTEQKAYDHITQSLSEEDENGFWIDFNQYPYRLLTTLYNIKEIYTETEVEWREEIIDFFYKSRRYDTPSYGFYGFDDSSFNDVLKEQLPRQKNKQEAKEYKAMPLNEGKWSDIVNYIVYLRGLDKAKDDIIQEVQDRFDITNERARAAWDEAEEYSPKGKKYKAWRKCLKCGKKFLSLSPANRICRSCTKKNVYQGELRYTKLRDYRTGMPIKFHKHAGDVSYGRGETEAKEYKAMPLAEVNTSCPVRTMMYGGIPAGGGYGGNTEFELGAQQIGEAVHCILGSLGKGKPSEIKYQKGHIYEELGIIERAVKEYRKPIYLGRIWRPNSEYAKRSVESLLAASEDLVKRARNYINRVNTGDAKLDQIAKQCYVVLIALAEAMYESAKGGVHDMKNRYDDKELQQSVRKLRSLIDSTFTKNESKEYKAMSLTKISSELFEEVPEFRAFANTIASNDLITMLSKPFHGKELPPFGEERVPQPKATGAGNGKPMGLWYGIGSGWIQWVLDEQPEWRNRYIYKLDIDRSKMLQIHTREGLKNLAKQYGTEFPFFGTVIDWDAVAKTYSGVEISFSPDRGTGIYGINQWDVPSGCIWDSSVIANIELIKDFGEIKDSFAKEYKAMPLAEAMPHYKWSVPNEGWFTPNGKIIATEFPHKERVSFEQAYNSGWARFFYDRGTLSVEIPKTHDDPKELAGQLAKKLGGAQAIRIKIVNAKRKSVDSYTYRTGMWEAKDARQELSWGVRRRFYGNPDSRKIWKNPEAVTFLFPRNHRLIYDHTGDTEHLAQIEGYAEKNDIPLSNIMPIYNDSVRGRFNPKKPERGIVFWDTHDPDDPLYQKAIDQIQSKWSSMGSAYAYIRAHGNFYLLRSPHGRRETSSTKAWATKARQRLGVWEAEEIKAPPEALQNFYEWPDSLVKQGKGIVFVWHPDIGLRWDDGTHVHRDLIDNILFHNPNLSEGDLWENSTRGRFDPEQPERGVVFWDTYLPDSYYHSALDAISKEWPKMANTWAYKIRFGRGISRASSPIIIRSPSERTAKSWGKDWLDQARKRLGVWDSEEQEILNALEETKYGVDKIEGNGTWIWPDGEITYAGNHDKGAKRKFEGEDIDPGNIPEDDRDYWRKLGLKVGGVRVKKLKEKMGFGKGDALFEFLPDKLTEDASARLKKVIGGNKDIESVLLSKVTSIHPFNTLRRVVNREKFVKELATPSMGDVDWLDAARFRLFGPGKYESLGESLEPTIESAKGHGTWINPDGSINKGSSHVEYLLDLYDIPPEEEEEFVDSMEVEEEWMDEGAIAINYIRPSFSAEATEPSKAAVDTLKTILQDAVSKNIKFYAYIKLPNEMKFDSPQGALEYLIDNKPKPAISPETSRQRIFGPGKYESLEEADVNDVDTYGTWILPNGELYQSDVHSDLIVDLYNIEAPENTEDWFDAVDKHTFEFMQSGAVRLENNKGIKLLSIEYSSPSPEALVSIRELLRNSLDNKKYKVKIWERTGHWPEDTNNVARSDVPAALEFFTQQKGDPITIARQRIFGPGKYESLEEQTQWITDPNAPKWENVMPDGTWIMPDGKLETQDTHAGVAIDFYGLDIDYDRILQQGPPEDEEYVYDLIDDLKNDGGIRLNSEYRQRDTFYIDMTLPSFAAKATLLKILADLAYNYKNTKVFLDYGAQEYTFNDAKEALAVLSPQSSGDPIEISRRRIFGPGKYESLEESLLSKVQTHGTWILPNGKIYAPLGVHHSQAVAKLYNLGKDFSSLPSHKVRKAENDLRKKGGIRIAYRINKNQSDYFFANLSSSSSPQSIKALRRLLLEIASKKTPTAIDLIGKKNGKTGPRFHSAQEALEFLDTHKQHYDIDSARQRLFGPGKYEKKITVLPDPILEQTGPYAANVILVSNNKVLLLKRGATAPTNPNKWELPGGNPNLREPPIQTAARECQEETGVTPQNLQLLTSLKDRDGFTLYFYIASSYKGRFNISWEHSKAKWADYKEATALPLVPIMKQALAIYWKKQENILHERYGGAKQEETIMYHGTHPKLLKTILSQGLIPNPKQRVWADDPDVGAGMPSRESYGGIYLTKNIGTALSSARHAYGKTYRAGEGQTRLLVAVKTQPRSLIADEDDLKFLSIIPNPEGFVVNRFYEAVFWITLEEGAGRFEEMIKQSKKAYKKRLYNRIIPSALDTGILEKEPHSKLKQRLDPLLDKAYHAALTRNVAYLKEPHGNWRRTEWHAAFREATGKDPEQVPYYPPDSQEAERYFMQILDQLTRTLKDLARKTDEFAATARILDPITYRGRNKIIGIYELMPYLAGKPAWGKVHYGKVPKKLEEWLKHDYGEDFYWKDRDIEYYQESVNVLLTENAPGNPTIHEIRRNGTWIRPDGIIESGGSHVGYAINVYKDSERKRVPELFSYMQDGAILIRHLRYSNKPWLDVQAEEPTEKAMATLRALLEDAVNKSIMIPVDLTMKGMRARRFDNPRQALAALSPQGKQKASPIDVSRQRLFGPDKYEDVEEEIEALLTEDLESRMSQLKQMAKKAWSKEVRGKLRDEDIERYVRRMNRRYDPTGRTAKYTTWLIRQAVQNNLIDVDNDLLKAALRQFHEKKDTAAFRDMGYSKDIMQFSVQEILDVGQRLADEASQRSKKRKAREKGIVKLIEMPERGLKAYKLTTVEACIKHLKNTGYCTRGPDYAKKYLRDGPLIYITYMDKPYVLIHEQREEAKEPTNDDPIDPDTADYIAPLVDKLNIKSFPELEGESFDWEVTLEDHWNGVGYDLESLLAFAEYLEENKDNIEPYELYQDYWDMVEQEFTEEIDRGRNEEARERIVEFALTYDLPYERKALIDAILEDEEQAKKYVGFVYELDKFQAANLWPEYYKELAKESRWFGHGKKHASKTYPLADDVNNPKEGQWALVPGETRLIPAVWTGDHWYAEEKRKTGWGGTSKRSWSYTPQEGGGFVRKAPNKTDQTWYRNHVATKRRNVKVSKVGDEGYLDWARFELVQDKKMLAFLKKLKEELFEPSKTSLPSDYALQAPNGQWYTEESSVVRSNLKPWPAGRGIKLYAISESQIRKIKRKWQGRPVGRYKGGRADQRLAYIYATYYVNLDNRVVPDSPKRHGKHEGWLEVYPTGRPDVEESADPVEQEILGLLQEDLESRMPQLIKMLKKIYSDVDDETAEAAARSYNRKYDPTGNTATYTSWLIQQRGKANLKDQDPDNVKAALAVFDSAKNKGEFKEKGYSKDIYQYNVDQIMEIAEEFQTALSKRQQKKRAKEKGIEKIAKDKEYIAYLVTTPEACNKYFPDTWCTERYYTAEDYLRDGPFIYITENNKPFALLHEGRGEAKEAEDDRPLPYTHQIALAPFLLDLHEMGYIDSLNNFYEDGVDNETTEFFAGLNNSIREKLGGDLTPLDAKAAVLHAEEFLEKFDPPRSWEVFEFLRDPVQTAVVDSGWPELAYRYMLVRFKISTNQPFEVDLGIEKLLKRDKELWQAYMKKLWQVNPEEVLRKDKALYKKFSTDKEWFGKDRSKRQGGTLPLAIDIKNPEDGQHALIYGYDKQTKWKPAPIKVVWVDDIDAWVQARTYESPKEMFFTAWNKRGRRITTYSKDDIPRLKKKLGGKKKQKDQQWFTYEVKDPEWLKFLNRLEASIGEYDRKSEILEGPDGVTYQAFRRDPGEAAPALGIKGIEISVSSQAPRTWKKIYYKKDNKWYLWMPKTESKSLENDPVEQEILGLLQEDLVEEQPTRLGRAWITPSGRTIPLGGLFVQVHAPDKIIVDLWENRNNLSEAEQDLYNWYKSRAKTNVAENSRKYVEALIDAAGMAPWREAMEETFDSGYIRVAGVGIELDFDPFHQPEPEAFHALHMQAKKAAPDFILYVDAFPGGESAGWTYVKDLRQIYNLSDLRNHIRSVYEANLFEKALPVKTHGTWIWPDGKLDASKMIHAQAATQYFNVKWKDREKANSIALDKGSIRLSWRPIDNRLLVSFANPSSAALHSLRELIFDGISELEAVELDHIGKKEEIVSPEEAVDYIDNLRARVT